MSETVSCIKAFGDMLKRAPCIYPCGDAGTRVECLIVVGYSCYRFIHFATIIVISMYIMICIVL